jgi:RNA polymerase sigma factor (sigma-70 family)
MLDPSKNLAQLMRDAKAGDADAERNLYQLLFVRFTTIAKRTVGRDAEDLAQEACLTVLEKYKTADFHKGAAAWAHQVLKNKIGNFIQGAMVKQKKTVSEDDEGTAEAVNPPIVDPLLKRDLLACLRRMTKKNPVYSRAMNYSFQGYSTEEVCKRLKIKPGNYFVILNRGREMMKNCLETGRV